MKHVLIVDDEKKFLLSLTQGLANRLPSLKILTAHDGLAALEILAETSVDLLITDLKMPKMDGFELLAKVKELYAQIPVIVMTAFGTQEIEARLDQFGTIQYLEKPTDLEIMTAKIKESLNGRAKGFVEGITLPTFAQLVELEKKTCSLRITAQDRLGTLFFIDGLLVDARSGSLLGDAAALEIFSWEDVGIEMSPGKTKLKRVIQFPLKQILLESMRQQDEQRRLQKRMEQREEDLSQETSLPVDVAVTTASQPTEEQQQTNQTEETIMGIQDKLKEFEGIDGFAGVGVFTPTGESLAIMTGDMKGNMKELGVLANNMLLSAQKASVEMGVGHGKLVHVETETAHILARCLNEGTDPIKTDPGKAHIHMVIALNNDHGIGMAKLKIEKLINSLADDFRM